MNNGVNRYTTASRYLLFIAIAWVVVLATALVFRSEHFSPGITLPNATYNLAFTLPGSLGTMGVMPHIHDSYFAVGVIHFQFFCGLFAFAATLHSVWPRASGARFSRRYANLGCLLVTVGAYVALVSDLVLGMRGMPRRYMDYPAEFQILHMVSAIGSYVIALGFFVAVAAWWQPRAQRDTSL